MAGATAGDQGDFFLIPVTANNDADCRIDVQFGQVFVGRGQDHPFDNIVNQSLAVIHKEFRHAGSFLLTVFQVKKTLLRSIDNQKHNTGKRTEGGEKGGFPPFRK
ncbi:hypothetical protein D3C80_1897030 [compost metagenome]